MHPFREHAMQVASTAGASITLANVLELPGVAPLLTVLLSILYTAAAAYLRRVQEKQEQANTPRLAIVPPATNAPCPTCGRETP